MATDMPFGAQALVYYDGDRQYGKTDAQFVWREEQSAMISECGVSDDLYQRVRQHFDGRQYVQLIMVINTINAWNRLSIATRTLAGTYHAKSD